MAYQQHYNHPQIYRTDVHMITDVYMSPARYGRAQPLMQRTRFETTVYFNYPSHDGGAPPLAHHPTFPTNSAAMHGQALLGARFHPAYDGEVAVLDAFSHVPIAAYRREQIDSVAAPPQRDDGLPEQVVSRFLKAMSREKATAAGGGDDEVCAVCLEDFCGGDDQKAVALRCRHQFHEGCIGKWLQKKNVCPLCKAVAIHI